MSFSFLLPIHKNNFLSLSLTLDFRLKWIENIDKHSSTCSIYHSMPTSSTITTIYTNNAFQLVCISLICGFWVKAIQDKTFYKTIPPTLYSYICFGVKANGKMISNSEKQRINCTASLWFAVLIIILWSF